MHLRLMRPVPKIVSSAYLGFNPPRDKRSMLEWLATSLPIASRHAPFEAAFAEEVALVALHHPLKRELVEAAAAFDQVPGGACLLHRQCHGRLVVFIRLELVPVLPYGGDLFLKIARLSTTIGDCWQLARRRQHRIARVSSTHHRRTHTQLSPMWFCTAGKGFLAETLMCWPLCRKSLSFFHVGAYRPAQNSKLSVVVQHVSMSNSMRCWHFGTGSNAHSGTGQKFHE